MELLGKYKLMLTLKRCNFKELSKIKEMVDKEYKQRLKNTLVKHK